MLPWPSPCKMQRDDGGSSFLLSQHLSNEGGGPLGSGGGGFSGGKGGRGPRTMPWYEAWCRPLHMFPGVQASSHGSWGCLMVKGRCVWGCPRVLDEEARWATSPRAVVHCEGQPSTLGAPLLESAYMTRYLGAKHDWTCVGKLEGPCMHLWLKGAGHSRLWRRSPITITPILPWYLVCTSKEGPCSVLDQNGEGG